MPLRTLLAAVLTLMLAAPAVSANSRSDAKAQAVFGIEVAQRGLWQEALYRWQRATELDPSYAAARNNLGMGMNTRESSTRPARPTRRRSS